MHLKLSELPDCPCGGGKMLPIEDYSQNGAVYLKGWFCPKCKEGVISKAGDLVAVKIVPALEGRK